jgi:hypothetical protein
MSHLRPNGLWLVRMRTPEQERIDKKRQDKHAVDFMTLAREYLFDTGNPLEFRNDAEEKEFYQKFNAMGHDHVEFTWCKCRKAEFRRYRNDQ